MFTLSVVLCVFCVVDVLLEQNSHMLAAIDGLNKKVANQDHTIADIVSKNDHLKAMRTSNTESTAVSRNERHTLTQCPYSKRIQQNYQLSPNSSSSDTFFDRFYIEYSKFLMMNQPQPSALETKPAFTARLSQHLTSFGRQQAVIFDVIETNVGNHYSPVSGVFTAPTNGTYYFIASILSFAGQYLETEIVLNGKNLALMFCNGQTHDQGTAGVVVALKQGDLVWVRHFGVEGTNVYGGNWSIFTGFMI